MISNKLQIIGVCVQKEYVRGCVTHIPLIRMYAWHKGNETSPF